MNTNPKAITVLCYGDSNTYGAKPDRSGRFVANERWPGILQDKLGEGHYVIEEGLGGRTTDLEHPNPAKPSRDGFTYFKACLASHMPLDVIIIMLGTNDLKDTYNRSAEDVAQALKLYPEYVKSFCAEMGRKQPRIILVSPAYMDEKASKFVESMPMPKVYSEVSAQKSRQLAKPIEQVTKETDCIFFDGVTVTKTGEDGCHLDEESHQNLADSLMNLIKSL